MQVRVTALKYHTLHGEEHHAGDTYDVDEALVETLTANGMAVAAPLKTAAAGPARAALTRRRPARRPTPTPHAPRTAKAKTKVNAKKKPARRK